MRVLIILLVLVIVAALGSGTAARSRAPVVAVDATGERFSEARLAQLRAARTPVFAYFTLRSRQAPVYAAAFLMTSVLELFGTGFHNWTWQAVAPISHLHQGNPPSVIAGAYCLLDAAVIRLAPLLPSRPALVAWIRPRSVPRHVVERERPAQERLVPRPGADHQELPGDDVPGHPGVLQGYKIGYKSTLICTRLYPGTP